MCGGAVHVVVFVRTYQALNWNYRNRRGDHIYYEINID